ncbi:MAG: GntR family transcriptional regulator [Treponemataceae bacterium]|nr:GntR family transcriptional regulator [Treponemataceae bacterium]
MQIKGAAKMNGLTISENVYHTLRKNIVNLHLRPGELLNVREITEKLHVSRTPVREALIRLEREGLIDVVPQVGTSVSKIDLERVEEEKFIRSTLEEKVIELCLESPLQFMLPDLEKALLHQEAALQDSDALTFLEWDDDFHRSIFHAMNKQMCWDLIQKNSGHYRRVRIMTMWYKDIRASVLEQHRQIYTTIKEKDSSRLYSLVHDHFTRIVIQEQELMQAFPDYFKTKPATTDPLVSSFISVG